MAKKTDNKELLKEEYSAPVEKVSNEIFMTASFLPESGNIAIPSNLRDGSEGFQTKIENKTFSLNRNLVNTIEELKKEGFKIV